MGLKKRRLGKTNLMVTELGLGAMDTPQSSEGEKTIQKALDLGVNFIDTAREYANSEHLIGEVIKKRGGKDFFLGTKSFNRTRDGIQYEVDRSLKILGVDTIDLYQLHDVSSMEAWEQVIGDGGALEGLQIAKFRTLIDYIGISCHNFDIAEKIIESQAFDTIMIEYSAFYRDMENLLPMAKNADIGIIVMRPLGGSGRTSAIRNRVSQGDTSLTPGMLLQYVLTNHDISVAIPGARFPSRISENVNLALTYQPMEASWKTWCENQAHLLF
ncbi:aldo/keto reductase [Dehalococcoidia bacterium]|nr:aldo/keto reductase [Dehalococcoidia bacterium]